MEFGQIDSIYFSSVSIIFKISMKTIHALELMRLQKLFAIEKPTQGISKSLRIQPKIFEHIFKTHANSHQTNGVLIGRYAMNSQEINTPRRVYIIHIKISIPNILYRVYTCQTIPLMVK